jgi:hypothetical protein
MIAIATMVIVIIMTINANCHYRESSEIGGIKSVVIRRVIGYICW